MNLPHPFPATRRLTLTVTALLALHVVLAWVTLQAVLVFVELVWRTLAGRGELRPLVAAHVSQFQVLRAVHAALWLLTGFVFTRWMGQARRNLAALGATGFAHRGGIAFNLLRAPALMREVWNASDPRAPAGASWRRLPAPARVRWWWGLLVAAAIADLAARVLALLAGGPLDLGAAMQVLVVGQLLAVAAAATGIAVVLGLDARQEEAAWRRAPDGEAG